MSIQAFDGAYCTPRENAAVPYSHVELGYPSQHDPLLDEYCEDPSYPTDTVYAYVPIEVVNALIEKHGGPDIAMSKHTPGPWTAHVPYPATNPRYAVTASYPNGLTFEVAVASMGDWSMAEARANATLIAAAPELLEALRGIVQELDEFGFINSQDNDPDGGESPAIGTARAAIAKATGKQ